MPQQKLHIPVATFDAARTLAGLIGEIVEPAPLAVTLFEAKPAGYVVEAYFAAPLGLARLAAALRELGETLPAAATLEDVPDENWVAVSQAALPPVRAGRFTVHGSHDRAVVGIGPGKIEIDAGEAFGTAHHATTEGCLDALDRIARRRAFTYVLDLGCGSGVLAIAAARLMPRARILASDIDPEAVRVAVRNAQVNRVASRVRFVTAAGLDHPHLRGAGRFDLVLANILAAPLVRLAPRIRQATVPGAVAILSGLLTGQAPAVIAAYRTQDFAALRHDRIAGWSTLTLRRR